ncbi:MAG TPA: 2-phospho-L-lactate guanylyltransferase, partial [Methanocorpusculum sp.]|nr:2-phospho-L-lactate guanylyltransferase [Methanocorpusculum sp.]
PVRMIMSDLPPVTKDTILRVVPTGKDLAVVPGLGGGTNILFIRHPEKYSVRYYGYSFMKHVEEAKRLGMSVEIIDSMRMSLDVDEPADLTELLIHGSASAKRWLEEHGFALSAESGRVSVKRGGKEIV